MSDFNFELSEEEIKRIKSGYQMSIMRGELNANAYISANAKKLGVDKKLFKRFVLECAKQSIFCRDKVLHYHRTSLENAIKILEHGALLNRVNIKLAGGDTSKFLGSSSSNVQFTVDKYNEYGELLSSGFGGERESQVGVVGADVVFVMGPAFMEEETYDCLAFYPTVGKADIRRGCVALLAKNEEIKRTIEEVLQKFEYDLSTLLIQDFHRQDLLNRINSETIAEQNE